MGEPGFTPGPWRWQPDDDFITADDGIAGTADIVERCHWYGDFALQAEAEANNRLIATAPDLYEALAGMVRRLQVSRQNWTQAAVDAQRSGNRELSVQIQNTVLTALGDFPLEAALVALAKVRGDV